MYSRVQYIDVCVVCIYSRVQYIDVCVVCMYRSVQYIDRQLAEEFYTLGSYPDTLAKKITLLTYFRSYMSEHLLKVKLTHIYLLILLYICTYLILLYVHTSFIS